MKKEECFKMLRDDETYKSVLGAAESESDRRLIRAHTEEFVSKFYDGFYAPMARLLATDPEALQKIAEQLQRIGEKGDDGMVEKDLKNASE